MVKYATVFTLVVKKQRYTIFQYNEKDSEYSMWRICVNQVGVTRWYQQNDYMAEGRVLGNISTKIFD